MIRTLSSIHPGTIFQEEFMQPHGLSQYRVAKDIGVSITTIHALVHGKRNITASLALLIARYTKTTPRFWVGLQSDYDLDLASDRMDPEKLSAIQPISQPAA